MGRLGSCELRVGLQPWVWAPALWFCGTPGWNSGLEVRSRVVLSVACSHTHPVLGAPSGLSEERSGDWLDSTHKRSSWAAK